MPCIHTSNNVTNSEQCTIIHVGTMACLVSHHMGPFEGRLRVRVRSQCTHIHVVHTCSTYMYVHACTVQLSGNLTNAHVACV